MKRILIMGAAGMAGHVIKRYLSDTNNYDIFSSTRSGKTDEKNFIIDVFEREKVAAFITSIKPEIIINCIGALVKQSANHPDKAIYTNAYFPHLLSNIADSCSAKVIHLSTDCVFNGKKGNYGDKDVKNAEDVYGQSKALGELVSGRHLTIRTSIIGPELKSQGEGLFHWFMQQAGNVNGFSNVFWSGITTLELACFINYILSAKEEVQGIAQITNGKPISKYELLHLVKTVFEKNNIEINDMPDKHSDKSLQQSQNISYKFNSYKQMLSEMKTFMKKHKADYQVYSNYL